MSGLFVLQKYSGSSEWSNGMQTNLPCVNMTCLQAAEGKVGFQRSMWPSFLISQNTWQLNPSKIRFLSFFKWWQQIFVETSNRTGANAQNRMLIPFSKTFPFNNDILKLWACICFAVAVLASVCKAGPQLQPKGRTRRKKRGYGNMYQSSIRRNIHISAIMFADVMFKKRLLSFLCFL